MTTEHTYDSELEFAKKLGSKAYDIAQKYYKKDPETEIKSDNSPVTIADEEINQCVIDQVKKEFPDHGVLGEEQSFGLDRDYLWVCDPIDGTVPFMMGSACFMFSLALVHKGDVVIAVAVNLSDNAVYRASLGGGSYYNNKKIQVSRRDFSKSRLFFPSSIRNILENAPLYKKLANSVAHAQPVGGGIFKGAVISEGLADGSIWLRSVHPWDVASVALLITEAGGTVTDRHGNIDLNYSKELDGIIMSNNIIHEDLLTIVREST